MFLEKIITDNWFWVLLFTEEQVLLPSLLLFFVYSSPLHLLSCNSILKLVAPSEFYSLCISLLNFGVAFTHSVKVYVRMCAFVYFFYISLFYAHWCLCQFPVTCQIKAR